MNLSEIFGEINAKVDCCLFKGLEDLDKSFVGEKDLDLLAKRSDQISLQLVLTQHGFRQVESGWHKLQHGTEHYIRYDCLTAQFHHIHIHYKIIFGGLFDFEYELPFCEEWIELADFHPYYPIKVLPKELEMAFELIRALTETNATLIRMGKNELICWFRSEKYIDSSRFKFNKKFDFLNKNLRSDYFEDYLGRYFFSVRSHLVDLQSKYFSCKLTPFKIFRLYRSAKPKLDQFLKYKNSDAKAIKKVRKLEIKKNIDFRSVRSGGLLISLVGADGTGKSTVSKELKEWLTWGRIRSEVVYFGEPKNLKLVYVLLGLRKLISIIGFSSLQNYLLGLSELIKAKKRSDVIKDAFRLRNKGFVVISDRYPLAEFRDKDSRMDSPKLAASNPFYNRVVKVYNELPRYPDVTLFLTADENVIRERRESEIQRNPLAFPKIIQKNRDVLSVCDELEISPIDTTKSWEEVWDQVRNSVWNRL